MLHQVLEFLSEEAAVSVLAAVVLALLALAIKQPRRWIVSTWLKFLKAWNAQTRIDEAIRFVSEEAIWLRKPIQAPWSPDQWALQFRGSKPIIAVAQLKGGVGKSTIAANLGAHFALSGRRVLFIDLDFQGSLSSMLAHRQQMIPAPGAQSNASRLIATDVDAYALLAMCAPVQGLPTAKAVLSYYDISVAENSLFLRWILREGADDIRFRLASILHDRVVQDAFDVVIIDAPPRFTTGAIQALCACTHVLIPTVLDKLSGSAIASFVNELQKLKIAGVTPHLKVLGVVGSMTSANLGQALEKAPDDPPPLQVAERAGLADVNTALARLRADWGADALNVDLLPADTYIQRLAAIANQAGEGLAILSSEITKRMFERLGKEIEIRVNDGGF